MLNFGTFLLSNIKEKWITKKFQKVHKYFHANYVTIIHLGKANMTDI